MKTTKFFATHWSSLPLSTCSWQVLAVGCWRNQDQQIQLFALCVYHTPDLLWCGLHQRPIRNNIQSCLLDQLPVYTEAKPWFRSHPVCVISQCSFWGEEPWHRMISAAWCDDEESNFRLRHHLIIAGYHLSCRLSWHYSKEEGDS